MKAETKNTINKINSLIDSKAKTISKLEKEKAEKQAKLDNLSEKFSDIVLNGDAKSYSEAKYQIEFLQYSVNALNDKIKKEQSLTDEEIASCQKLMNELSKAHSTLSAEALAKVHKYTPDIRKIKEETESDFEEISNAKNALSNYAGGKLAEFMLAHPTGIAGNGDLRDIFRAFNLF